MTGEVAGVVVPLVVTSGVVATAAVAVLIKLVLLEVVGIGDMEFVKVIFSPVVGTAVLLLVFTSPETTPNK